MTYPISASNHYPRRSIIATGTASPDHLVEAMAVSSIDLQYDPDDPSDAALVITLRGQSRHVDCDYVLTEMKSLWLREALAAQHEAVKLARVNDAPVDDDHSVPTGVVSAELPVSGHLSVSGVEIRYSTDDPSDAALAATIVCDGVETTVLEYPLTEVKAERLRNAAANQQIAVDQVRGGAAYDDGFEDLDGDIGDAETGSDNGLGDNASEEPNTGLRLSRFVLLGDPLNLDALIASSAEQSEIRGVPAAKVWLWGLLALLAVSAVLSLWSMLRG